MAKVAARRSVTPSSLLTGLVAYWALNEASGTRYDAVSANHLTPVSTVTSVGGRQGNGAQIRVADPGYLVNTEPVGIGATGSFTVAWWAYIHSLGPQQVYRPQLHYWSATAPGGPLWDLRGFLAKAAFNNAMAWFVGFGVSEPAWPIIHAYFETGRWNLFIGVADAGQLQSRIYCNDVLGETLSVTSGAITPPPAGTVLQLGMDDNIHYNDGIIDEVGIWHRVLTPTEMTALYNGGAGVSYPFTGV